MNAKAHVSFWGARYITSESDSSQWHIDEIIKKLNGLMEHNLEFCEKERAFGKRIVSKIDQLIEEDEKSYYGRNYLTRILYAIRRLFYFLSLGHYTDEIRWKLDYDKEHGFEYYTKNQYVKVFGVNPPSSKEIDGKWLAPTDRKA